MKKAKKKLVLHRESLRLLNGGARAADPWTEVLCPTAPNTECKDDAVAFQNQLGK